MTARGREAKDRVDFLSSIERWRVAALPRICRQQETKFPIIYK